MVQGMTGFGAAEKGAVRVEVRSLNHRFLDVTVKAPPQLIRHEMAMREALKRRFDRGKVDVFVSAVGAQGAVKVNINRAAARELLALLEGLREELSLPGRIDVAALLEFKGFFISEDVSYDSSELFDALDEALGGAEGMRISEGAAMAAEVSSRARTVGGMAEEIAELLPSIIQSGREKFLERLSGLLAGFDESRLLQEASQYAEKADITEEIARLRKHVEHLGATISAGGTIGRKLDFILQELNREANTIAAKSDDFRVLNIAVGMKAEIEKAREIAQNIQ
jgi:uncharacterized protein (TIGR00255 family)